MATKAMNTISMAATLSASRRPSVVPAAAASMALTYGDFSDCDLHACRAVSGVLVSGRNSLARYRLHGHAMTQVVSTATGSAP